MCFLVLVCIDVALLAMFAPSRRWDVGSHLQGYGRSVEVLFTDTGKFQVIQRPYMHEYTGGFKKR